jgi:hypothetical protein
MVENNATKKGQATGSEAKQAWLRGILWTVGTAAFLYASYWFSCEYHGHSTVGRDAHEALVDRDGKRLLALVAPEEVKANRLTEENLQNFIDDYVFRGVSGVELGDRYHHSPDFPSSTSSLYRNYILGDGRTMDVSFIATRSGSIIYVVGSLFSARAYLGETSGTLASDWITGAEAIDRDIDILNRTGIRGVYDDGAFLTWKEYAARLRELARRYPGS